MSKAEFESAKASFMEAYKTSQELVKYHSPADARKTQLDDVATAASRLSTFGSLVVDEAAASVVFKEAIFNARNSFHTLLNPATTPKKRGPKKEVVPNPLSKLSMRTKAKPNKLRGPTIELSEDEDTVPVGTSAAAVDDLVAAVYHITDQVTRAVGQMVVDDDSAKPAPAPAKASKRTAAEKPTGTARSKKATGKRAKTDEFTEFHEDTFLTNATAEFYAGSANVDQLLSEVASIADTDTDFLHNPLAMRKRMYYIMVELACIHEQFRSSLVRRQQLTEEGMYIRERLQELPELKSWRADLIPVNQASLLDDQSSHRRAFKRHTLAARCSPDKSPLPPMSSAEFLALKLDFMQVYEASQKLSNDWAPLDQQKEKLTELGVIANKLKGFKSFVEAEARASNEFLDAIFKTWRAYHILFNCNSAPFKRMYPVGYPAINSFVKFLADLRTPDYSPVPEEEQHLFFGDVDEGVVGEMDL
ncbi:hypothetical protein FB45DRAFT_874523 [Roridomyces roridus]|uniref:Uncharacterized protein n=1 Tax=Roridomyces roridus TaxID=1738132 RepID=A0AAD7FDH3_9AGAR|nr:hypothetical protein FB45DRAFT_874523 [Roridomyces roridus]